jgi:hypothetical protein
MCFLSKPADLEVSLSEPLEAIDMDGEGPLSLSKSSVLCNQRVLVRVQLVVHLHLDDIGQELPCKITRKRFSNDDS